MDPQRRLLPEGGCEALRVASLDKTATKASRPSIAQTPRIHSSEALAAAMMAAARAAAAVLHVGARFGLCQAAAILCQVAATAARWTLRAARAGRLHITSRVLHSRRRRVTLTGVGARAAMGVHSGDHIFSTSQRLWLWTSGVFRTKGLCSLLLSRSGASKTTGRKGWGARTRSPGGVPLRGHI